MALDPAAAKPADAPVSLWLPSPEATAELGARLARAASGLLPAHGLCLHLQGELGAGKTSLAQGLLRGLGVSGPIPSPTYTLVEPYDTAHGRLLHVDLYRLHSIDELEPLGVRDEWLDCALLLVEWPEKGAGALPPCDLRVVLGVAADGRQATLQSLSETGRRWREALCSETAEIDSR